MYFHNTLFFALLFANVYARTVTYNWALTWVTVNPDSEFVRPAIGINGKWPCPPIEVTKGDRVVVNLQNNLGNETASLHFHGIYQKGTNAMDGAIGVNQCGLLPGSSITYDFVIDQPGTYWYHSHAPGQLLDGLRGPIIVHDPGSPYAHNFTDEFVLTVTDWYHDEAPTLIPYYLSATQDSDGAEPVPYSSLINEGQDTKFPVKPGTTYMVRIVNMAGFSQSYVHFDQHDVTIIAVDGVYVQPRTVSSIYIAVAQRYDVLLTTKKHASKNYAIISSLDENDFDDTPGYLNPNATGHLVYDITKPLPPAPTVENFKITDDFTLQPVDGQRLFGGKPDSTINLDLNFFTQDNQNRAGFNNITWLEQKVPSLFTAMTTGKEAENPLVYGVNANAHVVHSGDLVEIVINNYDDGPHPMHLHGHQPQIVAHAAGVFNTTSDSSKIRRHDRRSSRRERYDSAVFARGAAAGVGYNATTTPMPAIPVRRDTWILAASGYTVIRFIADNPGVWLLHCHMEWHVIGGLTMTLIEDPIVIQKTQSIPQAWDDICRAQGQPTRGNAAGNTAHLLDLKGGNTVPLPNPSGAVV